MRLPVDLSLIKSQTAPIIHVDDDPMLIRLVSIYHKKSGISNPYLSFEDGASFLDYLFSLKDKSGQLPLIVLLDINMPGKNGFDILNALRSDEYFKDIPVCSMLTSSIHPEDQEKSKELGADAFLVKPDNAKEYSELFQDIAEHAAKMAG